MAEHTDIAADPGRNTFPEPIDFIRHVDRARWARGGLVHRVTVRLSNGHAVSFHEAAVNGVVTVCDSRDVAFDVLRAISKRGAAASGEA